ncbi:hypothetical protein D3C84_628740 [compost metagenome]
MSGHRCLFGLSLLLSLSSSSWITQLDQNAQAATARHKRCTTKNDHAQTPVLALHHLQGVQAKLFGRDAKLLAKGADEVARLAVTEALGNAFDRLVARTQPVPGQVQAVLAPTVIGRPLPLAQHALVQEGIGSR